MPRDRFASAERRTEIEASRLAEEARPFTERIVFLNGPYHTERLTPRMARIAR